MQDLEKDIIFLGGKGGVGKSTTAAALAWKAAGEGYRTLLVSTDPAHNLGDIFQHKMGDGETWVSRRLACLEINPERETDNYIREVKQNIKNVVQSSMLDEVNRQLDTAKASPGADEAALFDKLITIILEERKQFDKLIFDTAPTGHTIRLLSLPELMGIWIDGMLEKRNKTNENYAQLLNDGDPVEDPIYDALRKRQRRFREAREILLDGNRTGFVFVLNPERLPILETKKAIQLLDQYHLHVRTLVINKVLPEETDGNGGFLSQRKKHEKKYLKQIGETFPDKRLHYVPLFSSDITSKEQLEVFLQ